MHNAYISSTVYALRSKGSLSFSFNDYSCLLNERFDRNPFQTSFSQCCCCSCCGFSSHKLPLNPCHLYGPTRQSTLLQWPGSRKFILGCGDRYFYHCSPSYGLDQGCYDSLKERRFCNTSWRRSKVSRCCVIDEGDSGMFDDSRLLNEAEALLSLLSEKVDEDYVFGGKKRNWSSNKRVEVKGKGGFRSRERNLGLSERVKKRVNNVDVCCECGKKKVGEVRSVGGERNRGYESIIIESREEELRRNRESGAISRDENRRLRKDNSSCSPYYSLSSSGDFEDETEVHDKHTLLAEESLLGYEDSGLKEEGRIDGQAVEKYEGHLDDIHEHGEVSEHKRTRTTDNVYLDRRKKTENKHSDRLGQEMQHGRASSQRHERVSGIHGSSYEKTFSSHKQFDNEEDTSALAVSLDKHTRRQSAQNENQIAEASTSRRKFAGKEEIQEYHRDDTKRTSQSRIRLGSREENLRVAVNLEGKAKDEQQHKSVSYVAQEENANRNIQQVRRFSEAQDVDTQRSSTSQNQSEIGVKRMEGRRKDVLSSFQGREQSQHEAGREAIQPAYTRRESQQATKISEMHDSNIERTSILHAETNIVNQVQNTNLISVSYPESVKPYSQTGQRPPQRVQSGRGSHDVTDITVGNAGETERVTDSRRTTERRVHQESEATSAEKVVGKTRQGFTEGQIRPRKEFKDASTSQEPLSLDSQARVQRDDAEVGLQRSSQTMLMPPPSQLLSKSLLHVELASGVESQMVSSTTLESGSSSSHADLREHPLALQQEESFERNKMAEPHGEPLYLITAEDRLGSADRSQQSSAHIVGEFVEKMRHEVSTSEIQRVTEVSETTLASEDDKNRQSKLTQYASEDFEPKEHDRGRSSSGSGTKGPSDEMWDVSGPSRFRTPKEEKAEATTTIENAAAKRSGRSLWNIIADIVTLRWGSRPEIPGSTGRSGRKISSYESAPSESWFSTHESEQSKDKHARDKGVSLETTSSQMLATKTSTPGQGTESDVLELTEQIGDLESEPSSSTSMMQSRSTSRRTPLSGEENLGWNEDGKSSRSSPSRMEIVESSSQLAAEGESSTVLSQISDTRDAKSGFVGQMEQYDLAKSTEVLGGQGNSGELKRRKLQRIKQVPKDRFDEWEEAYKLESEQRKIDEMFMREALLEAQKAADTWEVPVGAVLVQRGKIIARGYNLVEELRDSTAHAEMICIREASNQLRTWRLADTTLYVTLEPCPMCAGAILQARITTLVWGAPNKLLGADGSWIRLLPDGDGGNNSEASDKPAGPVHPFHPKMNIRRGILASDCAEVMQQFFQLRRKKKEKQTEESPSSRLSSSHPSKLLKKMHDIFHVMFCL